MPSTLELMEKIERENQGPASDTLSLMDKIEQGDRTPADTLSLMDKIASETEAPKGPPYEFPDLVDPDTEFLDSPAYVPPPKQPADPTGKPRGSLDDLPRPATPPGQQATPAAPEGDLEQRVLSSREMSPQDFRALQLDIARNPILTEAGKARLQQDAAAVRAGTIEPDYVYSKERAQDRKDYGKSMAKALPRGAIEMGATALSPLALGEKMATANIRALVPRIQDAGSLDDEGYKTLLRDIHKTSNLSRTQRNFLSRTVRDVQTGAMKPEDVPTYLGQAEASGAGRAQEAMRGFAEEQLPIPAEHEETLPVQVSRGVGSGLAFLATRAATGPLGLALFAGSAGSGEAIERAIAEGATDEDAARAGLLGIVPGLTDMIPVERLLKPIAHIPGVEGALYAIVKKGIEQGAIEGTQESVQQILQNLVAKIAHTPEQEWNEEVVENGVVGALVGVLFGTGAGFVQATAREGDDGGASQAGLEAAQGPQGSPSAPVADSPEIPTPPAQPPETVVAPPSVPEPAPTDATSPPLTLGEVVQVLVVPTPQPGMTERDFRPQRIRVDQTRTLPNGTVVVLGTDMDTGETATFDTSKKTVFNPSPEQIAEIQTAVIDEARRQARSGQGESSATDQPPPDTGQAGKPVVMVVDGTQYDTGGLGPAPTAAGDTGRTGTLPKRMARTEKQLENILNEADRTRTAPNLSKEQKAAAANVKSEVLTRLSELESQAVAMQARDESERHDLTLTVKRVTGAEVKFTIKPDHLEIADLRKRIEKTAVGTFYSQEPDDSKQATLDAMDRVQAMAGENYRGMVADKVSGTPAATPLRREDILRPLLKDLGVRLYQGRMKGRKMLGFYRRHIEEVRIKNMNDVEVATHELAHALDDRFPEIRKRWNPATKANKTIREELRGVSYDQSKLFEGFAEFTRLWATQKDEAKALAPHFYGWFEDFLAGNAHGPALRTAQEQMHQYFEQDAVSRARSKIGVSEEINAGLTTSRDRFRQAVADDLHGIYEMERSLTGGIASVGAYEMARTSRAAHSIAEGVLLYGALKVNADGSHSFQGKGLQDILAPVAERLDGWIMYAVGRSSDELMKQNREHLFTKAEIRGMLNLETPEFKTAFAEYQAWNRAIVDFAQAKGLISPAFRASWKRAAYLPYHRVSQGGPFSAITGDWKGIRALTGGTENLRDILGNIIGNATGLIQAALINEARLEVANLATRPGGAHFMARIPSEEKVVKVHREEIRSTILESLGVKNIKQLPVDVQVAIDRMIDGMAPMTSLLMRGQAPLGRNIVTVLRGGKPTYYEVIDPLLYRAMTALKRKPRNRVLNFLSIMRRFRQSMITLTVNFVSKNLFRDTLMATVMSRHGFRPLIDSFKGLVSRATRDQDYKDFIANGGGMASYLIDEDAYRAHMEAFYARKGFKKGSVLHGAKELTFFVGRIADAVEMAARLGEYKRAIAKGAHPRHAAYSGREVSVDFAMRGDQEYLQYLYDGSMFLKAMMNGIDRFYRGVAHDPNRVRIAAMTGLFSLIVLANHIWNRDDEDIAEEYLDLPDWERDFYLHFYVPTEAMLRHRAGLGPKPPIYERFHHFRAPTVWEVGAIANTVTRSYDGFIDNQPAEAAKHIGRIAKDQFSTGLMPAFAEPVVESYFNYKFFTGRPIEPASTRDLPPYMRATAGTSRIARELGEAQKGMPRELQLSPAKIEALLDGYFNSYGTYGLTLADQMLYDDAPDMRFEDIPGFGVFYRPSPPGSTKSQEQFYEYLREATEARNAIRDLAFRWREDEARAGVQEFWVQQSGYLSSQNQVMAGLRRLRDRVLYAPDLESVQGIVTDSMAASPLFENDIRKLQQGDGWRDLGALKKRIRDVITTRRNEVLRTAVRTVEERKQSSQRRSNP